MGQVRFLGSEGPWGGVGGTPPIGMGTPAVVGGALV